MDAVCLTGSETLSRPTKRKGRPRKLSPGAWEEKHPARPLEHTEQWPHASISRSKLKPLSSILAPGCHNYPRETVTIHKHLCHFLFDLSQNWFMRHKRKPVSPLVKRPPNILKLEKSWDKHTAIQSTTSKEDKINLGFSFFFFNKQEKKTPRKQIPTTEKEASFLQKTSDTTSFSFVSQIKG